MADVIVASSALDVAAADEKRRGITRISEGLTAGSVRSRNLGLPIGGKQRISGIDGNKIPEEDTAGGDHRVGVVVMKPELGVCPHLRMQIQVSERIESNLLGRPAIIVVRAEVELVGVGVESARSACRIGDRQVGTTASPKP